jgi:2-polyprenyl-6-methoxyphenol hydroxylase-like FAD-dependent oxidoreductase
VYDAESNRNALTIDFSDLKDVSENAGFLFLPQDRTEALLLTSVQSHGKCDVRFGATVKAFSQDENAVTVEGIDHRGSFSLHGRYLVGCDGGHSIIRQQLGLQLEGKTYKTRVLIADVMLPTGTAIPTPRLALKANGPLVMLRFDDSRWRIVGTVDSGEADDQARSKNGVAARVRLLAGDWPFDLLWSSTFQIHNRAVKQLRQGRVFLAGDAAHLSSPAGGMGMNSGIEDANNLGWKLAAVLSGVSPSLLESYESERLYAVINTVEHTSDIASNTLYFAPPRLRSLFMALFRVMIKIRPVRRRILKAMSMLNTQYPESRISTGDRRWAGRLAPDCQIRADVGSRRLLKGRRGKYLVICYGISRPPTGSLETEEISYGDGADFSRAWKVSGPFCAIIRPDGFVGWAKEHPSREEIESAVLGVSEQIGHSR